MSFMTFAALFLHTVFCSRILLFICFSRYLLESPKFEGLGKQKAWTIVEGIGSVEATDTQHIIAMNTVGLLDGKIEVSIKFDACTNFI